ncbi:hypothetical protein [Nannocystis punicea]|uniref:Uncharacterized protein n=1 Tax=Nannocystis punicea TaxID=2995304 RepID=A0ABY7HC39_9BACT|nr:hypothetical protein [Nannocystis poenicansa]WAS96665.1 hypothetical protein O0S08_10985 [Nannocystis poenicansa]
MRSPKHFPGSLHLHRPPAAAIPRTPVGGIAARSWPPRYQLPTRTCPEVPATTRLLDQR